MISDLQKIGTKIFLSHRMGLMGLMGPKCEIFVTFSSAVTWLTVDSGTMRAV